MEATNVTADGDPVPIRTANYRPGIQLYFDAGTRAGEAGDPGTTPWQLVLDLNSEWTAPESCLFEFNCAEGRLRGPGNRMDHRTQFRAGDVVEYAAGGSIGPIVS